jgi:hypothetical protein
LPPSAIPLALVSFNVGVEIGQMVFVVTILLLVGALRQLEMRWPPLIARAPAYIVGGLGSYWTIDRIIMMAAN